MALIRNALVGLSFALSVTGCATAYLDDKNLQAKRDEIRQSLSQENPVVSLCEGGTTAGRSDTDFTPGVCALGEDAWTLYVEDPSSGQMHPTISAKTKAIQSFGHLKSLLGAANPTMPAIYQIQIRSQDVTAVFNMPETDALRFISELRERKIAEFADTSEIWHTDHHPFVYIPVYIPSR